MQSGDRIGRYLIQRRLAAGGMAEIFVAMLRGEAGFEKEIVLKRILPQWSADPDFVAMLIDEAKIAVQLNHPNIVQVYELAREDGVYYITMEYLRGVDLRRLMQKAGKKPVPFPVSIFIISEILEGLAYAHARKDPAGRPLHLIHRDISPQNILLSYAGEVKLTDFGIAKATSRSQETMTGVLKGKFAYMSPEQANQEPLDQRSDLYSLGIVLYELLTGERLFYRSSDIETLERVRRGDFEFSAKVKSMPDGLSLVLERTLSKKRDDRFADASAFRDALGGVAKKAGYDLSRPSMVRYLSSLFEEERDDREASSSQLATTVLPESATENARTSLLLEKTRTEVLASGIDPATEITKSSRTIPASRAGLKWVGWGAVALVGLLLIYQYKPIAKSENKLKIKESLEVKRVEPRRPTPPEVPPPEPVVKPNQVLAQTKPESPQPESRPVAVAPVATLKPEAKKSETQAKGTLSVQAIPWGLVSVDGVQGGETPRRLVLTPGRHSLRVDYAPEKASVSASVTVISGREIVCIAKLRGGKTIQCTK